MKEKELFKKSIENNLIDKESVKINALRSAAAAKPKRSFTMKKGLAIAATVMIVVVATLTALVSIYYRPKLDTSGPKATESYLQIKNVIKTFYEKENPYRFQFGPSDKSVLPLPEANLDDAVSENAGGEASYDYSKTNVQTEGLDEGDIVKTDGQYIYKLSTNGCYIVSALNGNLVTASRIEKENYVPQEMYIRGDKLVIIGGVYNNFSYGGGRPEPMMDCMCYISYSTTDIAVYDISDRSNPVLERNITLDGNFFTSRIIEADNKLLYMVNYSFYYNNEDQYIPSMSDSSVNDGEKTLIPEENIFYYEDIASYNYLIVGQIDLDEAETESTLKAYLGLGGTIYVSQANIYVATYDYYSSYKVNAFGWVTSSDNSATTRIVKLDLASLTHQAAGRVLGTVNDRYYLDEYNGYLRVATTVNWNSYSNIYVLKADLTEAGKITNIAPGERIYSVRFNGDKGSLVTFRTMDPYFNLDLKDPFNPKISTGLKEDGVSYYIHYLGETDYTIGVGVMTEAINDDGWIRVIQTGLKVSLYDNSSGEAVNIKTVTLTGSCYAEIFYNPKALLYDYEKGLFAFSYENWHYNYDYSYSSMEQGLAVFRFDLTNENDAEKLSYKGTLTNLPDGYNMNNYYNGYYDTYLSFIKRGVRIGDTIYTISDKVIKSYSLNTLIFIDEIDLN